MRRLFTIGYEGLTLAEFLARLVERGINLVVDVRELPLSRRKGFSKTPLSQALAGAGIEYRHERALGAPKPVRERLRADKDLNGYFRRFDRYLATQGPVLENLAETCMGRVALLCVERDPETCHRSSVARELGRIADLVPVHLGVEGDGQVRKAAGLHPRQSLPAT